MRKSSSFRRLVAMTFPYMKLIGITALCVLLINAAQLLKPYILKIVIDDFLISHRLEHGLYSVTSMGVFYMITVGVSAILSFAQVNLMNRAGQEIISKLRKRVFSHIQHLPLSYLDKFSTGRLITRATNDVEALNEMFTDILINLFRDVFLLIGIVTIMLKLNWRLALISFTLIPIIAFITNYIKNKIRLNQIVLKSLIGRINGFFAENISGMKLVQIFNREKEKLKELNVLNDEYFKSTMLQVRMNSLLKPTVEIFQSMAVAIVIWYGMGKIIGHSLELGILYAFTTYINQFFDPINDLAENYNNIQSALVSAERIFELLDQEEVLEDLEEGMSIDALHGEIEFRNVWFAYREEQWVLRDVSFSVKPGENVAFVGMTGAGKTTIINLISRFYKIQKGEILIDGININTIRLKDLRRDIAVVLQDVFLFAGDIKRNITLNSDISDDEVTEALKLSYAENFINELPNKMDEVVRERGGTFSAGQRQLISFARAIAHNPSIIVLDEATANIDTETELMIQKSIENISADRTMLIIAHRLSTIRNADKIIVLYKGKVAELGNHEELLQKGGYYKKLHDAQYA